MKHSIELEYNTQEQRNRILVMVRIYRQHAQRPILKSACFCKSEKDISFIEEYFEGLRLTLAVEYVSIVFKINLNAVIILLSIPVLDLMGKESSFNGKVLML